MRRWIAISHLTHACVCVFEGDRLVFAIYFFFAQFSPSFHASMMDKIEWWLLAIHRNHSTVPWNCRPAHLLIVTSVKCSQINQIKYIWMYRRFFFYSPVHTAHAKRANNTGTPPVVLQRTAKTPETNLMTHRVCDVRKLSEYQYVHAFALVNARNVLVDAYTPATRWRMMKNKRYGKSRIKYTRKQMLVVVVADWEIMKRGSCCKTMRQKRNRINRRERMGEKININGTNIHGMHECILCAHAMHRTKNLYKATYMWPSSAIAFCWVYSTIGVWEIIIIYMPYTHTVTSRANLVMSKQCR